MFSSDRAVNCRLCLQPATLRLSHIIPEFPHKDTYDADHAVLTISADLPYIRRFRKGLRERLLCDGCEGVIKRYEDYFARMWYAKGMLPDSVPASERRVVVDRLDYAAFKLFHLSILWRASVATREEFRDVNLGPHENDVRRMLLAGDPGSADRYRLKGCLILRPGTRTVMRTMIGAPALGRVGDHWVYGMIYGGCQWTLVISSHGAVGLDDLTFGKTGRLVLPAFDLTALRNVSALVSRAQRHHGGGPAYLLGS